MAKSGIRRAPARRRAKKAKALTRGLTPAECRLDMLSGEAEQVRERVLKEGGEIIGTYKDPLGGGALLACVLPISSVEPTPFQRDLSDTHHRRLADVIDKTGIFLDPIICVTAPDAGFWTPNGMHRLMALRRLGAKSVTALVVPKREVAWQILALNTEKAHNLKEKSLEVIRIYRGLIEEDGKRPESGFAFYLEEASFVTMGLCYEKNAKFAGGAYNPIVRRLEKFVDEPLQKALKSHEKHAEMLQELDERVAEVMKKLKDRGFVSPYLRAFVVARINPLRFKRGASADFDETIDRMLAGARRFDPGRIRADQVARAGGAPEE
jgi:ParB family chromosome partitioning protein